MKPLIILLSILLFVAGCSKEYSCEGCYTKQTQTTQQAPQPVRPVLVSISNNSKSNVTITGVWLNTEIDSIDIYPGGSFVDSVSLANTFYFNTKCANPLISTSATIKLMNGTNIIVDTSVIYGSSTNIQFRINNCSQNNITVTLN